MSVRRSFDDRLEAWLDEGPEAAPRELLAVVLETYPATAQRRHVLPWRMQMPTFARYAVLVAVLAIAGVLGATLFTGGGAAPVPAPTAAPIATPPVLASPSPSVAQADTVATGFAVPFSYRLDPAAGLDVSPDATTFQFRHTLPDGTHDAGVVVRSVTQVRASGWCSPNGPVNVNPSPPRILEILRQIPTLQIRYDAAPPIDGRPAEGITGTQVKNKDCPDAYLWPGEDPITSAVPDGGVRRFQPIDVRGHTVLVITFGSTQELFDAFLPTADAFIATLHWPEPSAAGSANP